ncbi:hypothetical protein CFC21_052469 [Triticum aestivum]|uniref:Uncharacterized protein n=3 Tax=Triticum TaxID=4564 RepID=A0A9R0W096_TRITD|nr:hypothetical protein CFC21_052469 [Triticum aestivum]VAH91929.1 unnamed protein product [Triticum turgidum subsp. durum]
MVHDGDGPAARGGRMAEQQQDEVGPVSALAWSKGSRASGGLRGPGLRACDATGRRRDKASEEAEQQ